MTNNLSEKWSRIEGLNSTTNVFSQPFPMLPQPQTTPPPPLLPLTLVGTRNLFLGMTPHYNRKLSSLIFFFSVTGLNHLSVRWMGPWEYDTSWKNSRQQQKEFKITTMWLRLSMKRWIRYWSVLSFFRILANSCYLM